MLYLISLGIFDELDLSIKALESIKKAKTIYLESYTNITPKLNPERVKEITREELETNSEEIVKQAKKTDTAILVGGDCLSATTHFSIILDAKKHKVPYQIIHGSSIFTAIAETGLQLYKFGATASIPLENKNIKSSYEIFTKNKELGLHTLFLLDLKPKENKFLSINQALEYLINQGLDKEQLCVGIQQLGGDQKIKAKPAKKLLKEKFKKYPQCIIIPGNLHFMEEDALKLWK